MRANTCDLVTSEEGLGLGLGLGEGHLRLGALGGGIVHDSVAQHEGVELLVGLARDNQLLVLRQAW